MTCPEFNTLVTAAATLIGALVGGGISAWVARQQASISLRQSRLNLAKSELDELTVLSESMSQLKADISDSSLTSDQIHSKLIDLFLSKATYFLSHSHLFPVDIENRVEKAQKEVNETIYKVRTQQAVDDEKSKLLVESLPKIEGQMKTAIRNRLRKTQGFIDLERM
jgi:gas vesicle protein